MARKKEYPGGFRLTLATARRLAVQEFGTAKGLEPDRGTCLEGFFKMQMGRGSKYSRTTGADTLEPPHRQKRRHPMTQ